MRLVPRHVLQVYSFINIEGTLVLCQDPSASALILGAQVICLKNGNDIGTQDR